MTERTVVVDPEPFECVPHSLLLDTDLSATCLRVYLILRKHRDYTTGHAWPGLTRVAELIGSSTRTVQRCIAELSDAGWLCVHERFNDNGARTSNLYHVHFDRTDDCSFFADPSDTDDVGVVTPVSSPLVTPVSYELRPNHDQDLSERKDTSDQAFDEFWIAYPRKIGKGQARRAFKTALRKTSAQTLIVAAVEFRQWVEREQTEQQFIPHASTWLNGERWTDERVSSQRPSNTQAHLALVRQLAQEEGYIQSRAELEAGD